MKKLTVILLLMSLSIMAFGQAYNLSRSNYGTGNINDQYYNSKLLNQDFNDTIRLNWGQTLYDNFTTVESIIIKYVYDSAHDGNTASINIIGDGYNVNFETATKLGYTFDTAQGINNITIFEYQNGKIYYNIFDQYETDIVSPILDSAIVEKTSPDTLDLYFNEAVNITTAGWSISGMTGVSISSVVNSGTTIPSFFLTDSITVDSVITISYDSTGSATADLSGNPLLSFTDSSVTNNVKLGEWTFTSNHSSLVTAPSGIAVDVDNQMLYVLEQNSPYYLIKINLSTWTAVDSIQVSGGGGLNLHNDTIYVAGAGGDNLDAVDINTFTLQYTHDLSNNTYPIGIANNDTNFYIGDIVNKDDLFVYNIETKAYVKAISNAALGLPFGCFYASNNIYVSNTDDANIVKVDLSNDSVIEIITGIEGRCIIVDEIDRQIITSVSGDIKVYDLDSYSLLNTIETNLSGQVRQGCIDSINDKIYICGNGSNVIVELTLE